MNGGEASGRLSQAAGGAEGDASAHSRRSIAASRAAGGSSSSITARFENMLASKRTMPSNIRPAMSMKLGPAARRRPTGKMFSRWTSPSARCTSADVDVLGMARSSE
jgi:hypothetical protein